MAYRVVIPARYASTRFPGKPLIDIQGKPMIWHVYQRALESHADEVVVATDDQRIADAVMAFDGYVVMTHEHNSGTDRIAEVSNSLGWPDDTIVVNLQGDEPLIPPELLDQVANTLAEQPKASMSTLAVPLDEHQVFDSNAVKVVTDKDGLALYFSRAAIPWRRGEFEKGVQNASGMYRHLGLYAYRADFLKRYVTWEMAPIEAAESLEQLRVLWQGERIAVSIADQSPPTGIDTEEDYKRLLDQLNAVTVE
jgi:3-deoxy-manno-octulosonate cytidylyltransferase (CMP-KDO synthetase)